MVCCGLLCVSVCRCSLTVLCYCLLCVVVRCCLLLFGVAGFLSCMLIVVVRSLLIVVAFSLFCVCCVVSLFVAVSGLMLQVLSMVVCSRCLSLQSVRGC